MSTKHAKLEKRIEQFKHFLKKVTPHHKKEMLIAFTKYSTKQFITLFIDMVIPIGNAPYIVQKLLEEFKITPEDIGEASIEKLTKYIELFMIYIKNNKEELISN